MIDPRAPGLAPGKPGDPRMAGLAARTPCGQSTNYPTDPIRTNILKNLSSHMVARVAGIGMAGTG